MRKKAYEHQDKMESKNLRGEEDLQVNKKKKS